MYSFSMRSFQRRCDNHKPNYFQGKNNSKNIMNKSIYTAAVKPCSMYKSLIPKKEVLSLNTLDISKINIKNVFSIGYRCNADEFLDKFLGIRKYSSPFSYMVIDIKTSLNFIETNFENYTQNDFIEPGKNTYKFNKHPWDCNNIHKISEIPNDHVDILHVDRVCIWNHHNLYDKDTINSLNRRSLHMLKCLNEKSDTTLLFYIEKIQKYGEKESYFDKNILDNFNCNCNFLILIPLLNFNSNPLIFYHDSRIKIIYFDSNLEHFATEIFSHVEQWNKLKNLITLLYSFEIEQREQ